MDTTPHLCPACKRAATIKEHPAGRGRKLYTVECDTEGCQFMEVGMGMIKENAIRDWNWIIDCYKSR